MRNLALVGRIVIGLSICVLIALIAGPAQSAPRKISDSILKMLPETSEDQVQLKVHLSNARAKDALLLWNRALSKHKFAKSPNGIALEAYLKFASGLETEGVDQLLSLKPKEIAAPLLKLWREAAPPKHFIWRSANLMNDPAWDNFFSEPRRRRPIYRVDSKKDLKKLTAKLKASGNRDEIAWYRWQIALGASIIDENQVALEQYAKLLNEPQASVPRDGVLMAQARTLFQMKRFKEAIETYKKVPKSSDFWLEALEERAWSHVRLEEFDEALARLKTLLAPVFAPQVGPEPHFMQSLVAVQRCDFPLVFRSFKDFRASQKPRIHALEAIQKKQPTAEQSANIEKLAAGQLDWSAIGSEVLKFPHLFHRDEILTRHIALYAQSKKEAKAAKALIGLAEKKGLKSQDYSQMLQQSEARANQLSGRSLPEVRDRLAHLATEDLENMKMLLQKLHVIEAEAIQRMYIFDKKNTKKLADFKKHKDQMIFPDNGEVWLDELTGYEVKSKGCPTTKISSN